MSALRGAAFALVAAAAGATLIGGWRVHAQGVQGASTACEVCGTPTNDLPNPYQTVKDFFKLPAGRTWGSTSAVDIDKDGKTIWVAERCGGNSCIADPTTGRLSDIDPILHFDEQGRLLKAFGGGRIVAPHGIFVDADGNVWITDYQANAPQLARGAGRGAAGGRATAPGAPPAVARGRGPLGPVAGATAGMQVFKFSPDGTLLMTLGKPGGAAPPECCYAPNDVLVAPNGTIFISEGHGAGPDLILKLDKTGKLITSWGGTGTGPGQFDQPHALAMDSQGRLFVGDRNNNRVQIFDQEGKFVAAWHQFSRPSGVFIDKNDRIYVADSESESVSRNHNGWKRGIRIGSANDGKAEFFIPDPDASATGTSAAEGVAADAQGNVYGAEVGPRAVKKYVRTR